MQVGIGTWVKGLTALVVLALFAVSPSGAATAERLPETGITLTRQFTFPDRFLASESVEIVTLFSDPDGVTPAISVRWTAEQTGWLPVWYITIESANGWIPESVMTPGTQGLRIGPVLPTNGETYEAAVSYHYGSGVLSFALVSASTGEVLIRNDWTLAPSNNRLYPSAGDHDMVVAHWYQPVGVRWDPVVRGQLGYVTIRIFDALDDSVGVRVTMQPVPEGALQLVAEGASKTTVVPLGQVTGGTQIFPLEGADLPLGRVEVGLQYVVDGAVAWASRTEEIHVGKVMGSLQSLRLSESEPTLDFTLSLESAGSLDDIALTLNAQVKQLTWDAGRRDYTESAYAQHTISLTEVVATRPEVGTVAVKVPLPQEEGLWRVSLGLTAEPAVATELLTNDVTLSTISHTIFGQGVAEGAIRICTYNMVNLEGYPHEATLTVLGGESDTRRINHFTDVIKGLDCDIIGIQEAHSVERMRQVAQRLGKNLAAFPSATRYPGAVLTDYRIVETRLFNHAGPSNQNEPFSRFGGATLLDVAGELLWVVNFHAWPHDAQMRTREAAILGERVEQLLAVTPNMVVMGDFNSTVGDTIDRTLINLGLVNAMTLEWIGGLQSTIPGGRAAIDHIYVSGNLADRVTSGRVYAEPGFQITGSLRQGEWVNSDHLPVLVELLFP